MCGSRLTHCINQDTMRDNEKPFWPPRKLLCKGSALIQSQANGVQPRHGQQHEFGHVTSRPSLQLSISSSIRWGAGGMNFSNPAELFKHSEMPWSLPWSELRTSYPTMLSLCRVPADCGGGTCWWLFFPQLADSVIPFQFSPLKETTDISEPESTLSG